MLLTRSPLANAGHWPQKYADKTQTYADEAYASADSADTTLNFAEETFCVVLRFVCVFLRQHRSAGFCDLLRHFRDFRGQCPALTRSTCMPYPRRQRSSWTRIKSSFVVQNFEQEVRRNFGNNKRVPPKSRLARRRRTTFLPKIFTPQTSLFGHCVLLRPALSGTTEGQVGTAGKFQFKSFQLFNISRYQFFKGFATPPRTCPVKNILLCYLSE